MTNENRTLIIDTAENQIPIHRFLGLKVEKLERNFVRISVPFREELVGDIRLKRWHGGIISTILDSVGGIIGVANFTSPTDKLSTIDLRTDFLKGAEASSIQAEARLIRLGNRIMVTRMEAFQNGELIAEGKGVYNFIRKEKSD